MLKGYRTIVANVVMAVGAIAVIFGIEIPPEELSKMSAGIISIIGVVNLILRSITNTKMGNKE